MSYESLVDSCGLRANDRLAAQSLDIGLIHLQTACQMLVQRELDRQVGRDEVQARVEMQASSAPRSSYVRIMQDLGFVAIVRLTPAEVLDGFSQQNAIFSPESIVHDIRSALHDYLVARSERLAAV